MQTLCENLYLLSFVICLLRYDSAALVTLCLYVVAYLVMLVSAVIQRQEEVGGLYVRDFMCVTGCLSYKS